MRIAYVKYEYPPDTADGGIATSTRRAARAMRALGHEVEVFASSRHREGVQEQEDGIVVHRILEPDWWRFNARIGPVFERRHAEVGFDVVEGADHMARAEEVVRRVPDIPLVMRLHTPQILCKQYSFARPTGMKWARTWIGALREGKRPWWYMDEDVDGPRERAHALEADGYTAPSAAIARRLVKMWGLDPTRIAYVPHAVAASDALLNVPVETRTNVVTYVGRVELLKGMEALARAIPMVLRDRPETRFRLVGASDYLSPVQGLDMRAWMVRELGAFGQRVEFVGKVPLEEVPGVLAQTDVCVVPSQWDNFPNACLEAMMAARGIVGTRSGGMEEMLAGGRGVLVGVGDPRGLAKGIVRLLDQPAERIRMGEACRRHVLEAYTPSASGA